MSTNPFPGPQPYRAADRQRFYGREALAKKLANQILARAATTVFGPSGSGKSSLLQAGVIPGLQDSDDVRLVRIDAWPAAEAPLPWLVNTIAADLELGTQPQQQNPIERLQEVIDLAGRQSERPMLVYLDQFEQLFIAAHDEKYMKDLLDGLTWLIRPKQNRELHLVLSLREDYLGRLRDWTRDKSDLSAHGFRVGPLTIAEMVKAMCRTAADGEPLQTWNPDELRELMFDVRVPGQSRTEGAEVQAAFAQIVCRAVWEERAGGKMLDLRTANAEAILTRYLDTTLNELGPLHDAALKLLEQQLIDEEGHRTLLTEKEARLALSAAQATEVLGQLEKAAILHAEEHQGSRYFELGHDWLAKKVFERRLERKKREQEEAQAAQLLAARRESRRKLAVISGVAVVMTVLAIGALVAWRNAQEARKRAEESEQVAKQQREKAEAAENSARKASNKAQQASRMAIAQELMLTGQPDLAAWVLQAVDEPQAARGWRQAAIDALKVRLPWRTIYFAPGETPKAWSHDGTRLLSITADHAIRIVDVNGRAAPVTLRDDTGWSATDAYFSPNDRYVFMGAVEGYPFVWSADGSGKPITLREHPSDVGHAAWSHDSKRIASYSEDGTVRISKADGSGTPIVHTRPSPARFIAWNPNDTQVLVADNDGRVVVYNADSENESQYLPAFSSNDIDWSPDGQRIAGIAFDSSRQSEDGPARIMIVDIQEVLPDPRIVNLGRGIYHNLQWSPDGRRLVAASNQFLKVVQAVGSQGPVELRGHAGHVIDVAWSPDGTRIASSSLDKTVRVWNSSGKNPGLVLAGHTDSNIRSLSWSADGKQIRTLGGDNTARLWNVVGPAQPAVMEHDDELRFGGFSRDGKRVLLSDADGNAILWNTDGSGMAFPLHTKGEKMLHASWSPSGNTIATLSIKAPLDEIETSNVAPGQRRPLRTAPARGIPDAVTLGLWSADAPTNPYRSLTIDGRVGDMAWSPDGQRLAITLPSHTLRIFDTSEKMGSVEVKLDDFDGKYLKWSPDGKRIAVFDGVRTFQLWNRDGTGKPIVLEGTSRDLSMWTVSPEESGEESAQKDRAQVSAWIWSPDSSKFASTGYASSIRVWSINEPDNLEEFKGLSSTIRDMSWSPDSSRIALASEDSTLRIWKPGEDYKKSLVLKGHAAGGISTVRWSPDGERVVTASNDKTARVWDLKNPADVLVLDAHSGGVKQAEWSPDGKRIVTISEDKTARVWLVDTALLQDALRASSSNCLTVEQRETLLLEDEAMARGGYEACEKAAGRAPQ